MKKLITLLLLSTLMSCSAVANTTLSFSADYKVNLPHTLFSGATVFSSDEISIKTAKNQLLSGKVLSASSEGLPAEFDMQRYPKHVLKIETLAGLNSKTAHLLTSTAEEIHYSFDLTNTSIEQQNGWTLYSLCKAKRCLAYVVKHNAKEYILTLHAQGIEKMEFIGLIKGGLHVTKS